MSGRRLLPVSALMSLVLVAGAVVGLPEVAVAAPGDPPAPDAGVSVPVRPVQPGRVPQPSLSSIGPRPVAWPSAASGVVAVDASGAGALRSVPASAVRVGGLPVAVRTAADGVAAEPRSPGEARRQLQPAPGSVRVSVAGQEVSKAAGVSGVIVSLERADGQTGHGRVALDIGYSGFRYAFGGDYGPRLRLVRLPGCVLSSPERAECRAPSVLPGGTNSPVSATVSADSVDVGAGSTVLAVVAGSGSLGGDWAASPLPSTGSWAAGTQSGDFTYQIPLQVPPAPAGPTPQVALTYSAQSVDGRTVSKNNQTSWVGEGWDLSLGYVERQYKSCRDLGRGTDDMCFEFYNLTMSLGGRTVHVLQDERTGEWRMADDSGWRVERLLGGRNGDNNGEYWRFTDLQGTQYYFGVGNRNGIDADDVSNAVWRMPVWTTAEWQEGRPCYNENFRWSRCTNQAWRWNLDYVVDAHGNTTSLFYQREQIYYGGFNGAERLLMDRGGYLEKIAYGGRAGAGNGAITAARVRFEVADRCLLNTDCRVFSNWPDTPWDRQCLTETCPNHTVPTFWSAKRLEKVVTEVYDETAGGFNYKKVDQWDLDQIYPPPGENMDPSLYFQHLTHTGLAGSTPVTYPRMIIDGQIRPNRVSTGPDTIVLNKLRVMWIWNGLGKKTTVSYNGTDCTRDLVNGGYVPVDNNTRLCYPQLYSINDTSGLGWFIKYTVDTVVDEDLTGASPPQQWKYHYTNTGSSTEVMWHFDSNYFTPLQRRTWSDWRGYAGVTVEHGEPGGPVTRTATRYYRGLDGDLLGGGARRHVTLTDTQGNEGDDVEEFRGYARESYTYLDGDLVGSAINQPLTVRTGRQSGYGPVEAHRVRTNHTRARTLIAATNTWRYTRTDTTFDDTYGLPVDMTDSGDEAVTGDETCTRTEYAHNPGDPYLIGFPAQITTRAGTDCAAGARLSTVQTFYDGSSTLGAAPSRGLPTKVRTLVSTGPDVWASTEAGYDFMGRITSAKDARGQSTTTAYVPTAAMMPLRQTVVTNPLGHTTTTTLDPRRGQPTTVVDANGKTTTAQYDAAGRLTKVWRPGRPTSGTPDVEYGYIVPNNPPNEINVPTAVTTKKLGPGGNQIASHQIFDGHGNAKQTQTPGSVSHGGRIITDTAFDARGLAVKTSTFHAAGVPAVTFVGFNDADVPSQTRRSYDTLERVTADQLWTHNTMRWQTRYRHDFDRTTVLPPDGGASRTEWDAHGRTTHLRVYPTSDATGTPETTRYTYNLADELTTITDPAGNTTRYTYDLAGRRTGSQDPDTGTTTYTYTPGGDLASTVDARGQKISFGYDPLGRQTERWAGDVATGTRLASFTYDTLAKGHPTASTRYDNNAQYVTTVAGYTDDYQPTGQTWSIPLAEGQLAGTYTVTFTYNPHTGAPATVTYPAAHGTPAETLTYGYDTLGAPTTLTGIDTYVAATTYNKLGQLTQRLHGTGTGPGRLARDYTYDLPTGRLATITSKVPTPATPTTWQTVQHDRYTYNPSGDITSITDHTDNQSQCYRYDPQHRLLQAWTAVDACAAGPSTAALPTSGKHPYWDSWTFDTAGRRTTDTHRTATGSTTRTYTYPAAGQARPHAMNTVTRTGTGPGTDTFSYDNAGNTTTRTVDGQTSDYTYNPENRYARAVVHTPTGDQETRHLYDATGDLLIRRDPTGTTLYAAGHEYTLAAGTVTCTRYYTHNGATVAARTPTALTWLAADHQASNTLAVNTTTGQTTRRWYTPYGADRHNPGWPTTRGFLNKQTNTSTGLLDLGARQYDPNTGTFLSPDPLVRHDDPSAFHPYAYAGHSPITFSDASGLCYGRGEGEFCARNTAGRYAAPRLKEATPTSCSGSVSACEHKTFGSGPTTIRFSNGTVLQYHHDGTTSINGYELGPNHPNAYNLAGKADSYRRSYPATGDSLEDLWITILTIDVACEEFQCSRGLGRELGPNFGSRVDQDRHAVEIAMGYARQGVSVEDALTIGVAAAAEAAGHISGRGGQQPFANGGLYESWHLVNGVKVGVLAEVQVDGGQLWLKDIAVYPDDSGGQPGGRNSVGAAGMLKVRREIMATAQQQGFTEVRVTYRRTSGPVGLTFDRTFAVPSATAPRSGRR